MLFLDGAPKGDFNFSFAKKNAPAFLLLHGFLLDKKKIFLMSVRPEGKCYVCLIAYYGY